MFECDELLLSFFYIYSDAIHSARLSATRDLYGWYVINVLVQECLENPFHNYTRVRTFGCLKTFPESSYVHND